MANGQLNVSTLTDITGQGDYATPATARDFIALRDYVWSTFGVMLGITEAYRDLAAQQHVWDLYNSGDPSVPFPPAPIGASRHGDAVAIDITGWSLVPGLDAVLARFGFIRDVSGEGWHIHHIRNVTPAGPPGTLFPTETPITAPPQEEDDMPEPVYVAGDKAPDAIYAVYSNATRTPVGDEISGSVYFARRRISPEERAVLNAARAAKGQPAFDSEVLRVPQATLDAIGKVTGSA